MNVYRLFLRNDQSFLIRAHSVDCAIEAFQRLAGVHVSAWEIAASVPSNLFLIADYHVLDQIK